MTVHFRHFRHALATACLCAPVLGAAQAIITPVLSNSAPRGRIVLADRIVAVVNDEAITRQELDERVRTVRAQMRRQGTAPPSGEEFEKQVLDRMITDRAQMHFARETAIRIDDITLDRSIARIAEENGMNPTRFRETIERDGIPYGKFREDIRSEITLSRLRDREVEARVQVSEGEIENYLAENKGGAAVATPVGVNLNISQILVRVPENASPEQIAARQKRAEEALEQLKSGKDFVQVSASFSDAADATTGGAFGWRSADRLPELFVAAVDKLKVGEVTSLVKSPNGFHIIKLNDRRGGSPSAGAAGKTELTKTRARHILIKVNEITTAQEAERRIKGLKERIDNKSVEFEAMAKQHSQDASAPRGGDLGWVFPGDTVPEFERAMESLQPGPATVAVQTPFGWHLIQVVERAREDVTAERQKQAARQAIRERKSEEAYQEWVRQIRDRAYVELRLEER